MIKHFCIIVIKRKQFDVEQKERLYIMTVRDLYVYSNEEQEFILFEEGFSNPCFKGNLEDCPTELIDRTVYQFQAIDFNTIKVVLL